VHAFVQDQLPLNLGETQQAYQKSFNDQIERVTHRTLLQQQEIRIKELEKELQAHTLEHTIKFFVDGHFLLASFVDINTTGKQLVKNYERDISRTRNSQPSSITHYQWVKMRDEDTNQKKKK
jgi:hypothetical protein